MKKLLVLVFALIFAVSFSINKTEVNALDETFEIAMITDSGTIDDESFNQGTYEGIIEFCTTNSLTYKYYKPLEVSDDAYLDAIELAIAGGAQVVVTPGYLFESSIYAAQTLYPDVKFILIDGEPHTADYATYETTSNTLSILFNEHESAFLAGYAAVYEGYTKLGFTGGMAVPAVVKFGIGFVAGAYYAADELDVTIELGNDTYHYFGDFAASDEHKNLASSWYVSGTEIIFAAAGGAGSSVMAAAADNDAMMIGVDIDQSGQSDTVLTSAMKMLANAVQQGLQAYLDDEFVGGVTEVKGAENDGVGLPMDTSRFTTFTQAQYDAIYAKLVDGTVVVPANYTDLVTFLGDATDYPSENTILGIVEPSNAWIYIVIGIAVVGIAGAVFFFTKKK
ncbi:MAG: BMP family ABC transporter substrate-binding protein [Firmicutes bacterium]|nr:BMP family ABC transporter substrate-binding protein [Bacillota bacterium]